MLLVCVIRVGCAWKIHFANVSIILDNFHKIQRLDGGGKNSEIYDGVHIGISGDHFLPLLADSCNNRQIHDIQKSQNFLKNRIFEIGDADWMIAYAWTTRGAIRRCTILNGKYFLLYRLLVFRICACFTGFLFALFLFTGFPHFPTTTATTTTLLPYKPVRLKFICI